MPKEPCVKNLAGSVILLANELALENSVRHSIPA